MIYTGEYTKEISFPIGGIGTGSFGIAGNGSFVDWEILNRPSKGSVWDDSHIAVKAKRADGTIVVKILNSDLEKDLTGQYSKKTFGGFGFGPNAGTMCGLPHFRNCSFKGEFPIAELTFSDDDFPAKVILTVFNPFIPMDADNSSIPAGFFKIEFLNLAEEPVEYTAVFSMRNPFKNSINKNVKHGSYNILHLTTDLDKESVKYGDISILTDAENSEIQQYWYRGNWSDGRDVFVYELLREDKLINRVYKTSGAGDVGSVAAHMLIEGLERKSIKFILSWNVPNNVNYWDNNNKGKTWKNYYAVIFPTSVESAVYSLEEFEMLYKRTQKFKDTLFHSTIDQTVIEAVSATLSVLKSPAVFRLEDGSFYGWEGVHEEEGSCEGTCQHVWNYAYALCFLFPDLERSIRENEFKYCTDENGKTYFRMPLPRDAGKPESSILTGNRPCLDGQMGTVIKTYREWKMSGDTPWLKSVWPTVKKILSYAWNEENRDRWDFNKDGVLEGRQHHTLDVELFGPSAWLQGFYLGALKAAKEMAEYLGDISAAIEYSALFEGGYHWTKENLFNGEYFIQKVDLKDKGITDGFHCSDYYWYEETGEIKYQIGNGCEIDQLCGQWHANLCGLGNLFDPEQVKIALNSLYKYNFKSSMRDVTNTWRIFALNDEGGTIMCSFPQDMPTIPLSYHTEVMTGFEYALAGLFISEGMEEEGLTMIRAIRDRYDGKKRNPWNEIECGSNYARAMASYALLPICSGFLFDLPNKMIGFNPLHKEEFQCFFSAGTAWGSIIWRKHQMGILIEEGSLELDKFAVKFENPITLLIDGEKKEFLYDKNIFKFDTTIIKKSLIIKR